MLGVCRAVTEGGTEGERERVEVPEQISVAATEGTHISEPHLQHRKSLDPNYLQNLKT